MAWMNSGGGHSGRAMNGVGVMNPWSRLWLENLISLRSLSQRLWFPLGCCCICSAANMYELLAGMAPHAAAIHAGPWVGALSGLIPTPREGEPHRGGAHPIYKQPTAAPSHRGKPTARRSGALFRRGDVPVQITQKRDPIG